MDTSYRSESKPAICNKIVHQDWEYQALTRRYAGYRKARPTAINRLKTQDKEDGRFYGWKTIREMVLKQREEEGYGSEGIEKVLVALNQ